MNVIDILIPLYILITLGFILKKYNFPNKDFWQGVERLTYFILFPVLVFAAILKAPMNASLFGQLVLIALIPAVISGLLQFAGFLSPSITKASFSSMYQGAVRNNTSISLVIIAWLLPDRGLALMAVIILIMVPFNNITSVLVMLRYGDRTTKEDTVSWWVVVLKNPLIVASALGLLLNSLSLTLPSPLLNTAEFLGRSALPLALLAVGAGLTFDSLLDKKLVILLSTFGKLVVTPAVTYALCIMLNVEADTAKVVIIFSAMPTAISSYILAKQMGGDADGMAQIITFQIIAAALTLPIILLIAQSY